MRRDRVAVDDGANGHVLNSLLDLHVPSPGELSSTVSVVSRAQQFDNSREMYGVVAARHGAVSHGMRQRCVGRAWQTVEMSGVRQALAMVRGNQVEKRDRAKSSSRIKMTMKVVMV